MNIIDKFMIQAINSIPITADVNVSAGLTEAKTKLMAELKTITNTIVIPIALGILGIILIVQICAAAGKHRRGEEWQDKLAPIFILIAAIILVGSSYAWLWQMLGV